MNLNKNNNNKKNKNQLNKDKLKGVVKTLNFKDISNNEKNEEKENTNNINNINNINLLTKKENKNIPKIKNILFSIKNIVTGKKLERNMKDQNLELIRLILTPNVNSFNRLFYKKFQQNKKFNNIEINNTSKEIFFISELKSKNKSIKSSLISD